MNQLTIASHNHKRQLWIERIKECRASNQTVTAWCAENDVSIKSYYYWMRKIKVETFEALPVERKAKLLSPKQYPAFTQVALPQKTRIDTCAIKLHFNDYVLEIQNGADSQIIEDTLCTVAKLC